MRLTIASEKHGISISYDMPSDKVDTPEHAKIMGHLAKIAEVADKSVDELYAAYMSEMIKGGTFKLFEMALPGFTSNLAKSTALEKTQEMLANAISRVGLDKVSGMISENKESQ